MRKSLLALVFLPALMMLLTFSWPAHADTGVCGQWLMGNCGGYTVPAFVPCGTTNAWLPDPTVGWPDAQIGSYGRFYGINVSEDSPLECDGASSTWWVWEYSRYEPISSCAACRAAEVNFWADSTNITRGQCTTIRWQVDNVDAVYFTNQGVSGQGAQQVCPSGSTTYYLSVVKNGQSTGYTLAVNVYEPAATAPPPPTAASVPTDNSAFVTDVTIKDGTVISPNQTFNKTWRVRNSGTTTWSSGYQLVHSSGERFGASTASINANVGRGETLDVTLPLQAPQKPGTYTGTFQLQNANARRFGTKLTVVIKVPTVVPARSISFMIRGDHTTYLQISGNNQNSVFTVFEVGDKRTPHTYMETTKHWWQGTLVVKAIGAKTGAHTCVIDDLRMSQDGSTPVTLDPKTNICTGDSGSAPGAYRAVYEAFRPLVQSDDTAAQMMNELSGAVDAVGCAKSIASGWSPNSSLKNVVNVIWVSWECKGAALDQLNKILQRFDRVVRLQSN